MNLDELFAAAGVDRAAAPFDSEPGRAEIAEIERRLADSADLEASRKALLERIGLASSSDLRNALVRLSDELDKRILATATLQIKAAFARSAEEGWRAWLEAVARFLSEFRLRATEGLCAGPFPFAHSRRPEVERLSRAVGLMRQSRWEDAYPQIEWLAQQECITGLAKARLVMAQGQIESYRFANKEAAGPLLERAAALAPRDGTIQAALGDLWLEQKNFARANECYDHAIEVEPGGANGYVGRGDSALAESTEHAIDDAEKWFGRAVDAAPGEPLGQSRLQVLFGRADRLNERKLVEALERRIALDPDSKYDAYLDAGLSFLELPENAEPAGYRKAEAWFRKAEALEPSWPRAYLSLADLRAREKRYEEAIAFCRKAIEVSPDYADAYVSLSDTYALANMPDEAVRVFTDEIPESVRHSGTLLRKDGNFHNRLGNLYYSFEKYDSAAREYEEAIREWATEPTYHRNLAHALQQQGEYAKAAEAFQRAFEADHDQEQRDNSLADLANDQGNAEYSAGRYAEAVDCYERAIKLRSSEPAYHSNLAGAWERIAQQAGDRKSALANAIKAFDAADRLHRSSQRPAEWTEKMLRLHDQLEVARACGDAALDRRCIVTPIIVDVAPDLVPLVAGDTESGLSESIHKLAEDMRTRVLDEVGVVLPGIRFRENEGDLPPASYVILLNEVPVVLGHVDPNGVFAFGARESLLKVGSDEVSSDPVTGHDGAWLRQRDSMPQSTEALQVLQPMEYVMRHVENVLRRNLVEFVGHQEVSALLENRSPGDVPRPPATLTALTLVCRAMVAEEAPIRPFDELYDCFARNMADGTPLREIVERIRGIAAIRKRLPGNEAGRRVLVTGANLEAQMRASRYSSGGNVVLAMDAQLCQDILTAARNQIDARPAVLVVQDPQLRPYVRKLMEAEFPQLPVLSRAEFDLDLESASATTIDVAARAGPDARAVRSPREGGAHPPDPQTADGETPPDIVVATSRQFPDQASLGDEQAIEGLLGQLQDALFYELGIILPTVRRDDDDPRLAPREFRLWIDAVDHGTRTGLEPNEFLVNDTPERLQALGVTGEKAANPASGAENSKVRETGTELRTCHEAGLTTWGPAGFVVLALSAELRKTAARFQTDVVTRFCLDKLRDAYPVLVDKVLERYPLAKIKGVLRALLQEEISIRDLRAVLESLLALNGTTDADGSRSILFSANTDNLYPSASARAPDQLSVAQLVDFVRMTLKRYISQKYTQGRSAIVVLLLDSKIEDRLSDIASNPLLVEERERLLAAVEQEWKNSRTSSPAILTIMEIRGALRKLLRPRFPDLPVIAFEELSPEFNIQPLARISMAPAASAQASA